MTSTEQAKNELEVQKKQELPDREEQTRQGRFYTPLTDIHETDQALTVVMEIPGVEKRDVDIKLEKSILSVEARISLNPYSELKPLYSEYGVGNYTRKFQLPNVVDQENIAAAVEDGVLTLTLPKVQEATPRSITIQ